MTEQQIIELIQKKEGKTVEFKQSANKDIAHEICAFANSEGGTLLIGVTDDGVINGCDYSNAKASQIQDTLNKITPPIELDIEPVQVEGKTVVAIQCPKPPGERKMHMVSGQIFVRKGASSQKLTSPDEVTRYLQYANLIHFDEAITSHFDYPDQFNRDNYDEFLELSGINKSGNDPLVILSNLNVVVNPESAFRNAGVLLFASDLQAIFDHAKIRVVQFRGTNKVNIHNDQPISGTVYEQYRECITYLKTVLNTSYIIEDAGPRKERLEIPETVLRESILNALAHRDYYEKGACIMVEIYEDRVEITNPGGLVPSISPDEFGKRSASRNPLLFGMFQRMRLVEQVGSGIERMRQAMKDQGLPEPQFSYDGMFIVKLTRPVEFEKWITRWIPLLNEARISILRSINENPSITKAGLSKERGISTTAIDKHLNVLKQKKIIERVGSYKTGTWKINKITPN